MTRVVPRNRVAGLTLIEMLVSLVIFAFVGLASFTMLQTLIQVQTSTDGRLEDLAQIDRALAVFTRDVMQGSPQSVQLTPEGLWISLGSQQWHSYISRNDALFRTVAIDMNAAPGLEQLLITGVQEVTLEVLGSDATWRDTWPFAGDLAPRAVRLNLILSDGRSVARLVPLLDVITP